MYKFPRILCAISFAVAIAATAAAQTKNFTPVEGASLKAKIDNAVVKGKAGAPGGRFWVGYQFEVRPGVAIVNASVIAARVLGNLYTTVLRFSRTSSFC